MAFNGTRLFRYALVGEAAGNIASAIPMILNPDSILRLLVRGPTMINPATRSFTQWFATRTALLTFGRNTEMISQVWWVDAGSHGAYPSLLPQPSPKPRE